MSFDYVTDENHETMKALITTEGILFNDEQVKKFYLIIKYYTIEIFENLWNIFGQETIAQEKLTQEKFTQEKIGDEKVGLKVGLENKNLTEYLDAINSYESLVDDSLLKKYEGIESEFQNIVILYTKYIFKGDLIRLKKPKLLDFLKAFFEKFKNIKYVQNGNFFQSSMIEQDFLFRDLFRQTLFTDCIKITQRKSLDNDVESVLPKFSIISAYSHVQKMPPPPVLKSEQVLELQKDEKQWEDKKDFYVKEEVKQFNETKEKKQKEQEESETVKSFHSYSVPGMDMKKKIKAPSEILLSFLQEEEEEKQKQELSDDEKVIMEKYDKTEKNMKDMKDMDLKDTKKQLIEEKEKKQMEFHVSDEEEVTEDDSISRVMEKMYMQTLENVENPEKKKKIKKIILN